MLSRNLEHFFPNLKDHFMCPTCLDKIPIKNKKEISEAHIIPKAAKGSLKTFLCRKCNSLFGANQDKWFGELIKLSQDDKPSIMKTSNKDDYFMIDNIKVNGCWELDKNNNFTFTIHKNRNSPEVNKLIEDKFRTSPPKIKLSCTLPLMRNRSMIDVGFLTAGYLMWFGHLGYSWVLQTHLDPIREQILNPEKEIINANYIATCNEIDCKAWIGFIPINDDFVLTFGIGRHIVIIPPRDRPDFYSKMGTFTLNLRLLDIRTIKLKPKPFYGQPVILMFDNRILVSPNMIHNLIDSLVVIHYTSGSNKANILHPISEDEYQRIKNMPNVIRMKARLDA